MYFFGSVKMDPLPRDEDGRGTDEFDSMCLPGSLEDEFHPTAICYRIWSHITETGGNRWVLLNLEEDDQDLEDEIDDNDEQPLERVLIRLALPVTEFAALMAHTQVLIDDDRAAELLDRLRDELKRDRAGEGS